MKRAMLRTLLVLIPGPVLAFTSVHLGNSLSAQCYYNFAYYAKQKGKNLTTVNPADRFVAGQGLAGYGWVSINRSCDAFIPQTYANVAAETPNGEANLITNWFKQALAQNPNCAVYIFNEYLGYRSSFDKIQSIWLSKAPLVYTHDSYCSKRFHDSVFASVKRANPGKNVYLLPVANILFEGMKLIRANQYAGIKDWKEFYSGLNNGVPDSTLPVEEVKWQEVHFGPKGMYMQMCIQYVCLFKEKPHNGPLSNFPMPNNDKIKFSVPLDFAQATWDFVWNFCVNNTEMTGVSGEPVNTVGPFSVVPVPDRRREPLPQIWLQNGRQGPLHAGLPAYYLNGAAIHVTNGRAATGLQLLASPVEPRAK